MLKYIIITDIKPDLTDTCNARFIAKIEHDEVKILKDRYPVHDIKTRKNLIKNLFTNLFK